jgi:predicted transcriptional regulator
VKEKIAAIAVNLRGLIKLEGSKKIVKAFGLVEMVLAVVLGNDVLEKNAIRPFLEFLVEIQMWHLTLREVFRVLVKGGISSQSHTSTKNNDS